MNLSLLVLKTLQNSPSALDAGKCLASCPSSFYTMRSVTKWTAEPKWEWWQNHPHHEPNPSWLFAVCGLAIELTVLPGLCTHTGKIHSVNKQQIVPLSQHIIMCVQQRRSCFWNTPCQTIPQPCNMQNIVMESYVILTFSLNSNSRCKR
jgi:hypothetical protein